MVIDVRACFLLVTWQDFLHGHLYCLALLPRLTSILYGRRLRLSMDGLTLCMSSYILNNQTLSWLILCQYVLFCTDSFLYPRFCYFKGPYRPSARRLILNIFIINIGSQASHLRNCAVLLSYCYMPISSFSILYSTIFYGVNSHFFYDTLVDWCRLGTFSTTAFNKSISAFQHR